MGGARNVIVEESGPKPAGASARPASHSGKNRIMAMKITAFSLWIALATAGFSQVPAPAIKAEKVQFQGGKVIVSPGARTLTAPEEATLPFNIVVLTNGTFTGKGGQLRTLKEG